ncbi:glutathione S-transferase [Thalassococcus sp. S3]|uniref:glutathione S-transferase n=1 Tax=Thalassococcus sp. S3 TaxID=2017482 RepID=UPI0010240D4A|nr:glutathione S-transferase [Thalassococcus sp. S3]QBF33592.1 glutathione S-transferase [Thalassococcus sp. S3]
MTYKLYIGDRLFSSWSLRGWLMFRKFGLPCETHLVGLYSGTMSQDLAALQPARLVPALQLPDGVVVGESLAMAETLAEHFPQAGLWPGDAAQRATARWLCAEMASGFSAIRGECPMQLLKRWRGFDASDAVRSDLDRVEMLWTHARSMSGAETGPLFGRYSLADVFFTPVAARIVGYGLPVSDASAHYCAALLDDPALHEWRQVALEVTYDPFPYDMKCESEPWPYPGPSQS